jgi:lipoprotein-anchoring transpeptidase ErfK/SrfK
VSRKYVQAPVVGNDFVLSRPRLQMAGAAPLGATASATILPIHHIVSQETIPVYRDFRHEPTPPHQLIKEAFHQYSLVIMALLFLVASGLSLKIGSHYWAAHLASRSTAIPAATAPTISGLNLRVPSAELSAKMESIINQPATLTVGDQTKTIDSDVIKSWLQVTPGSDKSEQYIRVKADALTKSLNDLASQYVKEPRNQVTVNHNGVDEVVLTGQDGTKLSSGANSLSSQATAAAKTVMDAKGLKFSTQTETTPFQAVTPVAYDKLIEVDVVSKYMWLYENGQLVHSYPISAGAPATPTPIGQFKIYSKPAIQDMRGFNADGSKYFQPQVRWINYFLPGGYAIHGNYWRPQSWFGAINSSHGCVSLPDAQAKEVYDWAPVGTTVLTHY